ncbi:MAG: arsenate reductase (glutaredoxin) [Acidocella sp. 20-57-95]|nr:MAG: arsenate reductase (glutaredoxin) [Acidocella sp. 20-57-95]OYV58656.1 MAG: arsenate reductase (glutaredoxin) [Acidocella sp. 21-58-7]HQT65153.1 arsenate reductase (glutaredoxin) [Acidocella sp.]HQU03565.1 arsenate reductase (glutaredoxin) [Acidocella sp.]
MTAPNVIIYFNPNCGTARNVLAMIRNAGIEPQIIEYLKTPPSREVLRQLSVRAGVTIRDWLREKDTPYAALGLDNTALSDDELLDAIASHPILLNRPIVVTPLGVRLCRPSELVLDFLPAPQRGAFTKEDGEAVVNAEGQHVL